MEKMTFSERLKLAMKESGFTQGSLAEAVGMAQPSVWRLVSGGAKGSKNTVQIAKALGVNPEWLSDGTGSMRLSNVQIRTDDQIPPESEWNGISVWDRDTPLSEDEVEVPFLRDIEFACGDGSVGDDDYNGFKLRFSKATLRRVGASTDGDGVLCFPVNGPSMEPVIPDGATVAVDTRNKKIIDGEIYAINYGGLRRIKQLYRRPGGVLIIRSFNREEFEDEEAREEDVEIVGYVFWYSVLRTRR